MFELELVRYAALLPLDIPRATPMQTVCPNVRYSAGAGPGWEDMRAARTARTRKAAMLARKSSTPVTGKSGRSPSVDARGPLVNGPMQAPSIWALESNEKAPAVRCGSTL